MLEGVTKYFPWLERKTIPWRISLAYFSILHFYLLFVLLYEFSIIIFIMLIVTVCLQLQQESLLIFKMQIVLKWRMCCDAGGIQRVNLRWRMIYIPRMKAALPLYKVLMQLVTMHYFGKYRIESMHVMQALLLYLSIYVVVAHAMWKVLRIYNAFLMSSHHHSIFDVKWATAFHF